MNFCFSDQEVVIRILDIGTIPDTDLIALFPVLSESGQARYQRIAREQRKKQFLVGRLLLRYLLAQMHHIALHQITLTERERQAPHVQFAGTDVTPCFSIAHSANWVACACSRSVPLGLDIEHIDARRNLDAISAHTFPAEEVAWLNQQPDRVSAFYQLWSRKEARFKLSQGYVKAATEHCYEWPHPALSVVLMTASALHAKPELEITAWRDLSGFLRGSVS